MDDESVRDYVEDRILADPESCEMTFEEKSALVNKVFFAIRKDLDILHTFLEDAKVSEIMVNGKDNVFIEREGKLVKTEITFESAEDLEDIIRRVAAGVHREINELNPIVDARLEDGSRVNAVYKNIALNGPILTVRKFPTKAFDMEDMIEFGTVNRDAADCLKLLVECGYNIFISGGTSSGKTTFLNVLSNYIPKHERVIVMEDSAELQMAGIKNIVHMECRDGGRGGSGRVGMVDLIKTSLRMRPDRIIVGEVRGKEVMDMIQAMNTGHDGSLSTGHGNSIDGMLKRLESMFLQAADFPIEAIRAQIAEGIDIMVHMGRMQDNRRKILEIAEVTGMAGGDIKTQALYKYSVTSGLTRTSARLVNREKLKLRGRDERGDNGEHGL